MVSSLLNLFGFFSSRFLKMRGECICFAQFVHFWREECLLFNFLMIIYKILWFFDIFVNN